MNRYQFEDLISEYIDNELPLGKRKEFEELECFGIETLKCKKQKWCMY